MTTIFHLYNRIKDRNFYGSLISIDLAFNILFLTRSCQLIAAVRDTLALPIRETICMRSQRWIITTDRHLSLITEAITALGEKFKRCIVNAIYVFCENTTLQSLRVKPPPLLLISEVQFKHFSSAKFLFGRIPMIARISDLCL